MQQIIRFLAKIAVLTCLVSSSVWAADQDVKIPVLVYHRFGSHVTDSMMIKTSDFEAQMKWLKDNGYTVVPLRTVVSYLRGEGPPPPAKSVVITADDGHKSVWTEMVPIVKKYNIPVTLFIYPSAISNASYAMTWDQLQTLKGTGLFDIQGHTYWHPNFKKDKKKLKPEEYQKFVEMQLSKSKNVLNKKMGVNVEYLAWPFGIYDPDLEQAAGQYGYKMAFSIDGRCASKAEKPMSQPRYMIVNGFGTKGFENVIAHCVNQNPGKNTE